MSLNKPHRASSSRSRVELWSALGLGVVLAFFVVSGLIAYRNVESLRGNSQKIWHTHDVLIAIDELLSTMQDAETGQRGYLLTGNDKYLEPYQVAVADVTTKVETVGALTRDNPVQQDNLDLLKRHINAKLAELDQTVALRRDNKFQAALAIVAADRGKIEMDAVRRQLGVMQQEENRLRDIRLAEMDGAYRTALFSGVLSSLLGAALTVLVFYLVRRAARAHVRGEWLQAGQVGLGSAMMGDQSVEGLADSILTFLAQYLGFQAGAVFKGEGGRFNRVAALGVPADASTPVRFNLKEGLLGKVAAEGEPTVIHDVPEGYMTISSALGQDKPRHLVLVPTRADGVVNAVIELGFLHAVDERALELLTQASASIGIALRSARYRSQLQDALEETQRQSEELQVQSEELRVSNEELEEQGRALKESQTRLEQQQVELEQTNSQLEEQAQTLETQRDELERTSAAIALKARELEQASQYKSDFLANMSHELRTPLNSLLILSKLLSDNPNGNLTGEQVKFAQTIESSGNDLLTLINDILDLSKIEAGHLEVRPESLPLQRLTGDLKQLFQPVADARRLDFEIHVAEASPAVIETDRQRLEQILKNLLSNAFKFTETGGVRLDIRPVDAGRLVFAVKDTGIGVPPEQQESIFEAFRQADGTISRRYGGTGLGLSISRELSRLLGGAITLESRAGEGSTFSITIPLAYDPAKVASREQPTRAEPVAPAVQPRAPRASPLPKAVEDDREQLTDTRRVLLVVEDDDKFAGIVRDLSREMGFQCLVASTAEEALRLARQFKPSAVVLDVGLPDESGLMVLDRLKRDDATRHIPIHVVSAADHSQTALSLGAIGYLVKPVKRDDLASVLKTLEAKLDSTVRRVLIVEDDPVQRDAVGKLLSSGDVETVGVGTAAECLEQLRRQTFDCMVLDLSLPDASGYSLLETLSQEGDHAFPPVIVYTGHDLSADDEQRLRRYSSSIIIKGAKSPERLLDEVSLFLHQVVSELPAEQQKMIQKARNRDAVLEGRRVLIVEDDIRNVYSLTNVLEPRGAVVEIARNGQEAIEALDRSAEDPSRAIDLVLMDVMMPVMDGLTAAQRIREDGRWEKLPILMLTAKAMPDDQERCIAAGANDYMAKPIDVDKLLSLVRVWMPR
ncbi:response regulator [Caulobacter sp. RL271]|jgi:CheY-like chemotaxis protein/CHASE3 domain sensor protein|uniref:histidine kinase n=1 Tax=Caulobacter segnis TaxID=88688 RepID=A0ABY4ZZM7_9CAUL|nr:response regulator [Caulobacter segnis]USQ98267.1 response regulator [Caulobacter segnis]